MLFNKYERKIYLANDIDNINRFNVTLLDADIIDLFKNDVKIYAIAAQTHFYLEQKSNLNKGEKHMPNYELSFTGGG